MKSITERFIIFCDFIINNNIAKNYTEIALKIGVSKSALTNIKSRRSSVGLEIVHGCVLFYENINSDWLITGRGEMIKAKTSPNSLEKEDVKISEVNTEDVISLLKEIKSEQLKGFANLKSILQPEKTKKEKLQDELEYAELVRKADELRAKLHSGELEIKNKPLAQKANK